MDFLTKFAIGYIIFTIAWLILSIFMCVWAYKRKGIVGLLLAIFLNWIGWIIVAFLPKDDKNGEREREREQN